MPGRLFPTAAALLLLTAAVARAETRFETSGGVTLVGQAASDDRVDEAASGSADLYLSLSHDRGRLQAYIEANSSLDDDGASTLIPESNADAGTALDPDRSGRIQISELKYSLDTERAGTFTFGLLDPTVYLDGTRISNDENRQFLGANFVNNPAIEFPDYTLGLVWERPRSANVPRLAAALTASNGIADNPNLSYNQLTNLGESDKGAFAAFEAGWSGPRRVLKAGTWVHTAAHRSLDDRRDDATNFGVYAAYGRALGPGSASLRVGLANPEVAEGSAFAAASWQFERGRAVVGAGLAHTWLSPDARGPDLDGETQFESYVSLRVAPEFWITPSLQVLRNAGFDSSETLHDADLLVLGLRFHLAF